MKMTGALCFKGSQWRIRFYGVVSLRFGRMYSCPM